MQPLARIGRFVVLRKLGEGAMGVVYAAYDEELERKLAIKVVLPGLRSERASAGQTRLLREAQALARVSHPNVVQVYEVGSVGDAVYIAMELVRGHTLGQWLAAAPRRWRDILAVFQQAGAGLAAAHAAGVVHRDIKPDNILVGDDGRARVLDFSLARPLEGDSTLDGDSNSLARTRAGALIGTPFYMSPEQLDGQTADARSDQFSFCVTLHEALYRVRPFAGASIDELRDAIQRGELQVSRTRGLLQSLRASDVLSRRSATSLARGVVFPAQDPPATDLAGSSPPGDAGLGAPNLASGAPAWIRRALSRGLQDHPAARYPDMHALLTELGRDPWRPWRTAALALGLLTILAAGVATAVHTIAARAEVCRGAAAHLAGVWDPERRYSAQRAVLATGVPFAATTWARVALALDTQAAAWVDHRNASCADTHLRGEQSLALEGRRNACLDARLRELDALARVLTEARPDTIERAVQAAADLRPLAPCDDEAALLARVPPPEEPALATDVDALRRRLARVEALQRAGAFKPALAEADAAHATALALPYPPVHAEAARARGSAALALTRLAEAVTHLEDAYHLANRAAHDEVMMTAAIDLVLAHRDLGHLDLAEGWVRFAQDALFRAGAPPGPTATLLMVYGRIFTERGRPGEALAMAEQALALLRGAHGEEPPDTIQAYNILGVVFQDLDRDAEALVAYDEGLALAEKLLGADHPGAVPLLNNRAGLLLEQERIDEALLAYRKGLEIRARVYGTAHPRYAFSLAQIAEALTRQARYTEAAEYFAQALAIRTRALGPDHPDVGGTLLGIGKVEFLRGNKEAAVRATQRAVVIFTRAYDPESPRVVAVKMNLAVFYRADGRHDAALALNTEIRTMLEKTLPPHHDQLLAIRSNQANVLSDLKRYDEAIAELKELLALQEANDAPASTLARTLFNLGTTHIDRGAPADAIPVLERALTLSAGPNQAFTRARVELNLAKALWDSRIDRPRARRLAHATATALRTAGPDAAGVLADVEEWLASLNAPFKP